MKKENNYKRGEKTDFDHWKCVKEYSQNCVFQSKKNSQKYSRVLYRLLYCIKVPSDWMKSIKNHLSRLHQPRPPPPPALCHTPTFLIFCLPRSDEMSWTNLKVMFSETTGALHLPSLAHRGTRRNIYHYFIILLFYCFIVLTSCQF